MTKEEILNVLEDECSGLCMDDEDDRDAMASKIMEMIRQVLQDAEAVESDGEGMGGIPW